MELNDLFITIPLINGVWLLLNRPDRAWVIKASLLLAILGVAWYLRPEQAGLLVIGPWAILILVPMWLNHWTIQLIHQRYLRVALVTTTVLLVLHPWSGTLRLRQMVRVLHLLLQGNIAAGLQLASQYRFHDPAIIHLGEVLELQQSGDWQGFEDRMQARFDRGVEDSSLLAGRLLATAHLGNWEAFADLCESVAHASFSPEQNTGLQLRAWAILGDLPAVQSVLRASGHLQARENREFWLALAEQMSGQVAVGRLRLLSLLGNASPTLRAMSQRLLDNGPLTAPDEATVGRRAREALRPLRKSVEWDARFAIMSGLGRFPAMTLALGLVLFGVFLCEIPGGSEDLDNLERMGALVVPMRGDPGEWTRMLTCGFLHFGPMHLAMNLLGLLFLGRLIERASGRIGLLLHFLTCLALSGVLLPSLTFLPEEESAIFAGASGGIMGLLGGIWGNLAIGRLAGATPRIRQQFRSACSFIGLQMTCDILTPGVSMTCHMIGLVTGIVIGLLFGAYQLGKTRSGWDDSAGLLPN
jgi:rhomboid protease GluP